MRYTVRNRFTRWRDGRTITTSYSRVTKNGRHRKGVEEPCTVMFTENPSPTSMKDLETGEKDLGKTKRHEGRRHRNSSLASETTYVSMADYNGTCRSNGYKEMSSDGAASSVGSLVSKSAVPSLDCCMETQQEEGNAQDGNI